MLFLAVLSFTVLLGYGAAHHPARFKNITQSITSPTSVGCMLLNGSFHDIEAKIEIQVGDLSGSGVIWLTAITSSSSNSTSISTVNSFPATHSVPSSGISWSNTTLDTNTTPAPIAQPTACLNITPPSPSPSNFTSGAAPRNYGMPNLFTIYGVVFIHLAITY
jgi:hypothetical protein